MFDEDTDANIQTLTFQEARKKSSNEEGKKYVMGYDSIQSPMFFLDPLMGRASSVEKFHTQEFKVRILYIYTK